MLASDGLVADDGEQGALEAVVVPDDGWVIAVVAGWGETGGRIELVDGSETVYRFDYGRVWSVSLFFEHTEAVCAYSLFLSDGFRTEIDVSVERLPVGKHPIGCGTSYHPMALDQGIRVEDVMSTPLETVSKGATIAEAAAAMRQNGINALVVTTSPPSIVTSTDVLEAAAAGHDPTESHVADVMTTSVETVSPELFLEEVAAMMTSLEINHFPVVDVNDEYIGMVSSTDVAAQLS